VTKIKFRHLGEKGKAAFKFNINNGRYVEIDDPDELRRQGVDIKTMQVRWDNSNYIIDKLNNPDSQLTFVLPTVEPENEFANSEFSRDDFAYNDFDSLGGDDGSPF
jgi:hypothetical protein